MSEDFFKAADTVGSETNEQRNTRELQQIAPHDEESFAALLHSMNSGNPLPKRGTEKRTDAMSILMDIEGDE